MVEDNEKSNDNDNDSLQIKAESQTEGRFLMTNIKIRYRLQQYITLKTPRKITDNIWWNRHYLLLVKNMRIISNTIDGFSENGA
jgi:hypothetical protein